jgi:integrase
MARKSKSERVLPRDAKRIAKAVKEAKSIGGPTDRVTEFRIDGCPGLVLHVLGSGTATWYFHYDKVTGAHRKRQKFKLGRYPDLMLGPAVDKANEVRVLVADGKDPAGDKRLNIQALTFGELAEKRFSDGEVLSPTSVAYYRVLLTNDILPFIGKMPAALVVQADVLAIVNRICARGSTRRADVARVLVSSIFKFGMDRAHVAGNPASGMNNRHHYQPRDVVANEEQIRRLWHAIDDGSASMDRDIGLILKLALLTLQRRKEITHTGTADVSLKPGAETITLHRSRTKNRNTHRVPMSPQVRELVNAARNRAGASPYLFPTPGDPAKPIWPRSVSKALERTCEDLALGKFTVHDLRRTAATFLTKFGVPEDIRKRVLNHGGKRTGNVTEDVYSWYDYDPEKRAALELWADAVDAIVAGNEVEIDDYPTRLARLRGSAKIKISGAFKDDPDQRNPAITS